MWLRLSLSLKLRLWTDPALYINDTHLDNVQSINHLGHILNYDLSDDKDVTNRMYMYNRKANAILSDFRHISGDLRVRIMQAYCSSYYGSQLWNLSNKCLERLYTSWRKSIRKAFNIPMRTHCAYIPLLCKCMQLNVQLEQRYVKGNMNNPGAGIMKRRRAANPT